MEFAGAIRFFISNMLDQPPFAILRWADVRNPMSRSSPEGVVVVPYDGMTPPQKNERVCLEEHTVAQNP